MKKKMTFGIAFSLALKERGYLLGLVIAVVAILGVLFYLGANAWYFEKGALPITGVGALIAFCFIFARPANISADPVAAGYPDYTN